MELVILLTLSQIMDNVMTNLRLQDDESYITVIYKAPDLLQDLTNRALGQSLSHLD
jgi:hypothetical protein